MKKTFIDRAIEFVSPAAAVERYKSRMKLDIIDQADNELHKRKRKYDGASYSRGSSDWQATGASVNQEIFTALARLRNRARDLGRNNPYAKNAFRVLANNVVGTGIIPEPQVKGRSLTEIKKAWTLWGESIKCDYDQTNDFFGLQWLVIKTLAESGECLIRKVRANTTYDVPLRLQVLEGDFIDTSMHTGIWSDENTITYYGIKFSKTGERLGYWIFKQHPNEFATQSVFVPADDIIHLYEVERPGQIRGVPIISPVMNRLRDLDDYEMTERIRAKIAAAFTVFVTKDDDGEDSEDSKYDTIEPGAIKYLNKGEEITVAHPPLTQGFGEFTKNNLKGIASGVGISYEGLTGDYSNVNFSSARMGLLEFMKQVEHLQLQLMIPRFCNRVYEWFVEAIKLNGSISSNVVVPVKWTVPRREMIDPYKEIMALKEQVRAGFISWQEVVKMFGYIPTELEEELKQDAEMFDKLGLKPTSDARFDANRPPGEVDPELMKDDSNKDNNN